MGRQHFPEPTAGALIFSPKGELFLMRSHKWHGRWVMPGGHVELGERIEDALRREIKEETGLSVHGIELVCFQEFINDKAFWKPRHFIFFDFACRTRSTRVRLNSEGQEHGWFAVKKALRMPLEPYTKKTLLLYLRRRKARR